MDSLSKLYIERSQNELNLAKTSPFLLLFALLRTYWSLGRDSNPRPRDVLKAILTRDSALYELRAYTSLALHRAELPRHKKLR